MQFFGRENWKTVPQIKPRLCAEHGIGARAGAVGLELAVFEHVPQQIEVLSHRRENLDTNLTKCHEFQFAKIREIRVKKCKTPAQCESLPSITEHGALALR